MNKNLHIARLVCAFGEAGDVGGVEGLLVLFLRLVVFANVVVLVLVAKDNFSLVNFLAVTKELDQSRVRTGHLHLLGDVVQVFHFLEFFVAYNGGAIVPKRFCENLRLVVGNANVGVGLVVFIGGLDTYAEFGAVVVLDKQGDGVFFLDALEHFIEMTAVHQKVQGFGGPEPKEVFFVQGKVN